MARNQNPGPGISQADMRACRTLIHGGSKSFYFASLFLPRTVRDAALALYAFCRVADDLVDDPGATATTLVHLRARLAAAFRAEPYSHVADRALAYVAHQHGLPHAVLSAMVEGFEWDLEERRYNSFSDVLEYCARVASTVGVMMTLIMGKRSQETLARAADLGAAMQLTNIARDVGEDARNGRLYLPRDWMKDAGVDPDAFLAAPTFTPALGQVVERLLDEADRIYARGLTGLSGLPMVCRPAIYAAGLIYADIGNEVRKNGFNSINQRAHTSRGRKMVLLSKAASGSFDWSACDPSPALRETQFLVEAGAASKPTDFVIESSADPSHNFWDVLHALHCRQQASRFVQP